MEPAIRIDQVSYSYDSENYSIEDINLTIEDNEFVAIIGQNGAGKSTLLKNLTGLLRPTKGDIYIRGKNARAMPVSVISREIGFVLQNPDRQLFAATVYDEVAYALVNAGMPQEEIKGKVGESLESVGLSAMTDMFPPALSKGDRAKVVIASVLAMGSKTIILDEPTSGQDYRSCHQIMNIAKDLHRRGRTVIFVTHNMSLVAEYALRAIVMTQKRVLWDGRVEDVFNREEELARTHILPPQIVRHARQLRREIPLETIPLTVAGLGEQLLALKRAGKADGKADGPGEG
ncbi:MAG: energy-coupling factor ABC transporter ATP-binding protein [Treponema sp.]|jgi:energy-coupling factor transport system ATP-binding protein|nr:energy-coupling factor ABC transporter ATP-binding protein [Treponema sp.]